MKRILDCCDALTTHYKHGPTQLNRQYECGVVLLIFESGVEVEVEDIFVLDHYFPDSHYRTKIRHKFDEARVIKALTAVLKRLKK